MTYVDGKELNAFVEKSTNIKVDGVGIIRFKEWLCVPNDKEFGISILDEAYHSKFSIHPGMMKMYQDLKCTY